MKVFYASPIMVLPLLALATALATPGTAQTAQAPANSPDAANDDAIQVGEVIVTAQRRSTDLQDTSAAITAIGGATLDKDRVMSFEDLASRATSLSFTALSPLDQEFNVRGITNTRLDSPSADQSIGIFVDDVYVGRSGLFNFDLYDVDRVEVIRGPQGVLLGRNVVGGAVSIYSATPKMVFGGSVTASYGNYDERLLKGHVTGPLSDSVSARLAFQVRKRNGFNHDILHDVDLDNVDSKQLRGQLQWKPADADFSARLVVDYTKDTMNGFHTVVRPGTVAGPRGWSTGRAAIGVARGKPLGQRESLPEWPTYKGDSAPSPQDLNREAYGITLELTKELGALGTLTSITGWRSGNAFNLYSQTGVGPQNGFGVTNTFLFTSDVKERERIRQYTQEVRIVSPEQAEQGFDWIFGAYLQRDRSFKADTIIGKIPASAPVLAAVPALRTLSGESAWRNRAVNESYAFFGQLGYRFSPEFRIVGGLRYSHDKKVGIVSGFSIEGGDVYNPNDLVPETPLGSQYLEGTGYVQRYGRTWSELTPQVTAEFKPSNDVLLYATYSTGYKGGGFEDDPANAIAAAQGYDPETVTNYELGAKLDLFNRRARLNLAAFYMRYKDLQVTQTFQACLCNLTDNAADATIKGVEAEATIAVARGFSVYGGLTLLDTKYVDFTDGTGTVNDGKFLQRTPNYQWNVGADFTTDIGSWQDGFSAHINYNKQGRLFWDPAHIAREPGYGLLDGRVSIKPVEMLTISVWGRNLANKLYRTNVISLFGDEASRLGAPRTYGVEVAATF